MAFFNKYRQYIYTGIFTGILFAVVMAGFDHYTNDKPFSLNDFCFRMVIFGIVNAFLTFYRNKNKK